MKMSHCSVCDRVTGHKRALGAGTLIGGIVTGGISLLAIPAYPSRCIICGNPEDHEGDVVFKTPTSEQIAKSDHFEMMLIKGFAWFVGVIVFFALLCRVLSTLLPD